MVVINEESEAVIISNINDEEMISIMAMASVWNIETYYQIYVSDENEISMA